MASGARVGVYVDVENLTSTGGFGMRFNVLREFAVRDGAELVRLNAYVAVEHDPVRRGTEDGRKIAFLAKLREVGYKVIEKPVRWFRDPETGAETSKANADLDMAVDLLLQSERLDRVLLATGDGDFVQVVRAIQNRGCRVEAVAFQNVSHDFRREVDLFMPGYLIPELLPPMNKEEAPPQWGRAGSRVFGTCYTSFLDTRGYAFLRFVRTIAPTLIWPTDTREVGSPYETAWAHIKEFQGNFTDLQDAAIRPWIFEFTLQPDTRERADGRDRTRERFVATHIVPICRYS
jgi:uncharacterized LabA/DUF88 family protein